MVLFCLRGTRRRCSSDNALSGRCEVSCFSSAAFEDILLIDEGFDRLFSASSGLVSKDADERRFWERAGLGVRDDSGFGSDDDAVSVACIDVRVEERVDTIMKLYI